MGQATRVWAGVMTVALAIGALTTGATAGPPERVDVLIGFRSTPGRADRSFVERQGGNLKHSYHLVPAVAASVPETAVARLRANPRVTAVEPDGRVFAVDSASELDATWGVARIGAGTVHTAGNVGAGVRVAVLDSGIDTDHPDVTYDPNCSRSFVSGSPIEDGNGHGTHTAGTVAAVRDGAGVVGAAPSATLCIYKVLSDSGSGSYSDVVAALQQAVTDGVRVTNNSYGSSGDPGTIVKAAFDNAYAAGVLHAGAAGNAGNPPGKGENCIFPARWSSVIATAATNPDDSRASFSSTCGELELAAPGSRVRSTVPGGYAEYSGTSMAAPHVAGAAALVLAANPTWTNTQLRSRLVETSQDLGASGHDTRFGHGLVRADLAVTGGGSTEPPPPPPPSETGTASVASIGYATSGGPAADKHLDVTVAIVDGGESPVGAASVSVRLERDGATYATGSGTTGGDGRVVFSAKNTPSGTYTTTVTDVSASGLTWDGVTPANGFTK